MWKWKFYFLLIFLPQIWAQGEDTVASDLSVHQLTRLVEMVTPKECEDLLSDLSHREEDVFHRIQRLLEENNQLGLNGRFKRDTVSIEDEETQCRAALTGWLQKNGEKTDFHRLSRALQHIGRTDIALELGKNVNQDKLLNLKHHVEDYHKFVQNSSPDMNRPQGVRHRVRTKKESNLSWRDMSLIMERAAIAPYSKSPLEIAQPFVYGILLGFGGTLVVWVLVFFFVYVSQKRHQT